MIRLVHHIPGRLRLRVPASVDAPALIEALERLPGVHGCTWSERTRGLLVLYEPGPSAADTILEALDEHGPVEASHAGPAPTVADPGTSLARAVTDGFGQLDDRIRRATRGVVGLGGLLPVALTLWAVRELALGRAAPLAWSSALWYAHGLFRDYNPPSPR